MPSRETTECLTAYSLGDEALADALPSALYRVEWERHGLSAEQRTQISAPGRRQGGPIPERLRFNYVGEIACARGFEHFLFTARSTRTDRLPLSTVLRVDVDPNGRVIWLEMVWLFGNDVHEVRPVLDPREFAEAAPILPGVQPLLGVASADGREAYYAFGRGANDPSASTGGPTAIVGFYAVDSDGLIRPGAWTYGQSGDGLPAYGEGHPSPRPFELLPDDLAALDDYLESLG